MIRQAFLELLEEKPLEKITIADIVKRADINRATFYAHYTSIQNLIESIMEGKKEELISLVTEINFCEFLKDPIPLMNMLIDFANKNATTVCQTSFFTILITDTLGNELVSKAMNIPNIPEEIRNSDKYKMNVYFIVGGFLEVYRQIVQNTIDVSVEEVADILKKLICDFSDILSGKISA